MNIFFFNLVNNLNVQEYYDCKGIFGNISDAILKAIAKYRNHLSIKAITRVCNSKDFFFFWML